jgi:hypothetical protein
MKAVVPCVLGESEGCIPSLRDLDPLKLYGEELNFY